MLCVGNVSAIITSINSTVTFTQIDWPGATGSAVGAFNEAVPFPATVPVPAGFPSIPVVSTNSAVIWKCAPLKIFAAPLLSVAVCEPLLTITLGTAKVASKLSVACESFLTLYS